MEFAAKEKLEIVLTSPVQGEADGRGVWGEFRPPSPAISVRIFSNRHRQLEFRKPEEAVSLRSAANLYSFLGEKEKDLSIRAKEIILKRSE